MPTVAQALSDFRRCYSDLLLAAERLNAAAELTATPPASRRHHHETIQRIVAAHFGFTVEKMLSRDRHAEIALMRQTAVTLTREFTKMTFEQIGAVFRLDHGTIIHATRAIDARASVDGRFANELFLVREKVKAALVSADLLSPAHG